MGDDELNDEWNEWTDDGWIDEIQMGNNGDGKQCGDWQDWWWSVDGGFAGG